jgi:tetratricopeptide (TPR) repeat protein
MAQPLKKKTSPLEAGRNKSPVLPWRLILQALVIAAAVLLIYWPALHGGWLVDDDVAITNNTIVQSPTGLWSIWFEPGHQIDYYPVKASVQWMQWRLWGMDTLGYHLTNVLLHIVGALLVWRLLSKFHLRLAWLGGLIFAVHPVQVESVAWISELKNTLSLPPFLLAMCAYLDYEEHGKSKDYWLALGLFLVAMLCKLSVVLFPLVILLYAWWRRGRIGWRDLKASAPFFLISLLVGLITIQSGIWNQRFTHTDPGAMPVGGLLARLDAVGLSLSFCFSKAFLPVGLLPIYPKWTIDPSSTVQFLPWLVLGGVIGWLWTIRERWGRHALLGLGFFLIYLAPCPGFIPAPDMAFTWVMDHFLYLPIIGLIGLVVAALGRIEIELPASFRFYGIGLLAVIVALLAFGSHSYAKMFINQETLWTYELQHNPDAYVAHNNLGNALLGTGRLPEAMEQYELALQIKPDLADTHYNLGNALLQMGRLPEAMEQYEQALRLKPDYVLAYNNLGDALQQAERLPEAMEQYEQALRLKPEDAETHYNLGHTLLLSGRAPEAIQQFELALQIKPDDAETHYYLGNALFRAGRSPEAIDQYEQALSIKPEYAEAHGNLGFALQQTGHLPEAMEQFEQALRIKPDYAEAHYNLGNVFFQTGQLADAIDQYEQALRIKPDYAEAHGNLGVALYEAGRVSEAVEQFEQVLRINPHNVDARNNLARLQALQKNAPAKN